MDSPRETRDGSVVAAKRGEPAVVYPASDVGSEGPVPTWNLRTERQTLRASGGERQTGAFEFLVRPAHRLAIGLRVAQRGVADARELVGKRADGFVVIGARRHGESPLAQGIDVFAA